MSDKDKWPFQKRVAHLQQLFGMDFKSAMDSVQDDYSRFKDRNQTLTERQNDQSNAAAVQLISHFALLATLSLTVVGFLLTQSAQTLTDLQKITILFILIFEVSSLFFGAWDYLQTMYFHRSWAALYQRIGKEVDAIFDSGELQWSTDMSEIEAKHLKDQPESTKLWVTYAMVGLCLAGLLLLIVLFYAYFFDAPMIK